MAGYSWLRGFAVLLLLSAVGCVGPVVAAEDWTRFVNPFIGTEGPEKGTAYNAGNIFPGAAMPFGVVKAGIDTTVFNASCCNANGGYTPDGFVTAITLLHESGTGGGVKYGVVGQMPLTTLEGVNVLDNLTYMQPRKVQDKAEVGLYRTELGNGVVADITATRHAGLMKYSYTEPGERYVLVDVSHFLPTNDEVNRAQFYSNGQLEVSDGGKTYKGYGIWRGGFNDGPDYTVFFCGEFSSTPKSAKLFTGPYTDPYWPNTTDSRPTWLNDSSSVTGGTTGYQYSNRIGALFVFDGSASEVMSKVGVSWISAEKACKFVDDEVDGWDFDGTVQTAKKTWNDEVFSKITTTDFKNVTRLTMFYSALYKMHLIPSDRTGESPNFETNEPYYDDYYTLWDTFRCTNSLWLLIEPDRAAGMIISLISIWRNERFMPDGRSGNYNGRVQGGSNADNVLADAYVKGLQYGIDWQDGYAAMKTDAERTPYNNFDIENKATGSTKEGRGALDDWLKIGFVSTTYSRSLSLTVEYSLNDFALSVVAKELAPDDYQKYLNRSAGWRNLWVPSVTSNDFSGFLAPKQANGTLADPAYDPKSCGECEWSAIAYEALPFEYSWNIPHDMQTLIMLMGGPATTERRLDLMFKPGGRSSDIGTNDIGDTLFNPGNEPSFSTPFLYNYLGKRQWKSVLRSRQVVDQYYSDTASGLPGNSDGGSLDSWLVWQMLGLYPVVTQPVYLLLSPWFDELEVKIPSFAGAGQGEGTLRITAEGLADGYYVQSVKLNGESWTKSWVSHKDIEKGGTIEFVLGAQPVEWDTGDLPPSPGHVEL
ncbi:alpha-1,2-mannosidase family protein-like protein [Phyllosticta capitalensis]|uniref:Alpha-1,2-mannosidase family protein-like protein n=1 Tax=Phyllosticta capitalensis TaxID=121624 RepID=A0ABR1YPN2_9PEZI